VSHRDIDRCAHDYRAVVNDAGRVAGVDLDQMAAGSVSSTPG
jgi:hypothetical protein